MEPWADKIIQSIDSKTINILDVSNGITLFKEEHEHDEEHDEDEDITENDHAHEGDGHNHEYDPHIWTSPVIAKKMVEIRRQLSLINLS